MVGSSNLSERANGTSEAARRTLTARLQLLQGFNSFLCCRDSAAVSEGIKLQSFRTILAEAVGPPQRKHVCIIGLGQDESRAGTPRLHCMFKPEPRAMNIALAQQRGRPSQRSFLLC